MGDLTIYGKTVFSETTDVDMSVDNCFIQSSGACRMGTDTRRSTRNSGFTLKGPMKAGLTRGRTHIVNTPTGNNGTTNDDFGTWRALQVNAGMLSLNGVVRTRSIRLAASIAAGANQMTLRSVPVGWAVGDILGIGITSYYGNSTVEYVKIVTIAGASVGFARCTMHGGTVTGGTGILKARWGVLQYPQNVAYGTQAVGLTKDNSITFVGNTPQAVDQSATVVNFTSNAYVRGVDDAVWASHEFGGHVMAMNKDCTFYMRDIEMTRMGQGGLLGRYPWHVHGMSVNGGTTILGVANNCEANGVTVRGSPNRAFVHHATYGSRQINCVASAIGGYATFLESGAERYYTITGNVMMDVYDPPDRSVLGVSARLKVFDAWSGNKGAGGYWLANMGGEFSGNTAIQCLLGIANTPHTKYLGIAANLTGPVPVNMNMPVHRANMSHSHRGFAMGTGITSVIDEEGNPGQNTQYAPTTDELPYQFILDPRNLPLQLTGFTAFKCPVGFYANTARFALYKEFSVSDWNGHAFQGSLGDGSFIEEFLLCGSTLNVDSVNDPVPAHAMPEVVGIAGYHGGAIPRIGVACNLKHGTPFRNDITYENNSHGFYITSSLIGTWDAYLNTKEDQFTKAVNIQTFNALFAYRVPPTSLYGKAPYIGLTPPAGETAVGRMLSSVWHIPPEHLGGAAGQSWVYDIPFLTHGKTKTKAFPTDIENGTFVSGTFAGIQPYIREGIENYTIGWTLQRQSSTGAIIDTHVMPSFLGAFQNMKHICLAVETATELDTWYLLTYPELAQGNDQPSSALTGIALTHQLALQDIVYVGVRFPAGTAPTVFTDSFQYRYGSMNRAPQNSAITDGSQVRFAAATTQTRAGLMSAPVNSYWQDGANNIVWAKVGGGLNWPFGAWPGIGSTPGPTTYERRQTLYFRDVIANV